MNLLSLVFFEMVKSLAFDFKGDVVADLDGSFSFYIGFDLYLHFGESFKLFLNKELFFGGEKSEEFGRFGLFSGFL